MRRARGSAVIGSRVARHRPAPAAARVTATDVGHAACDRGAAVEAARILQHTLLHGDAPSHAESTVVAACRTFHAAIEPAACIGFVTDDSTDPVGLEAWSLVHLVRTLAHRKPAFEIPLRPRAAVFDAVCTWRYGAAGAIARADRGGGEFLPGEASAEQLVTRGEVDAVPSRRRSRPAGPSWSPPPVGCSSRPSVWT